MFAILAHEQSLNDGRRHVTTALWPAGLGVGGRVAACATVAGSVVLVVGEVVLAEVTKFQLG